MWDLPRPGLEPVSPALAGGFSTTAPPGKPTDATFICIRKGQTGAFVYITLVSKVLAVERKSWPQCSLLRFHIAYAKAALPCSSQLRFPPA